MSTTIELYYARKPIIKRILAGGVMLALGVFAWLRVDKSGLVQTMNEGDLGEGTLTGARLGLILAPFIAGSGVIIFNLVKLFLKKPRVTLGPEGIFLAAYAGWKTIAWNDISGLSLGKRKSVSNQSMEPCIILKLTEDKAKKVFDTDAEIRTRYLDIAQEELYEMILKMWETHRIPDENQEIDQDFNPAP